jgi:hypothetical protein
LSESLPVVAIMASAYLLDLLQHLLTPASRGGNIGII